MTDQEKLRAQHEAALANLHPDARAALNRVRARHGLPPLVAPSSPRPCEPIDSTIEAIEMPAELPPVWIRGWNFAVSITRWTLAGMPRRSQAEISERLAICQACPFLQEAVCSKCGCPCVDANQLLNKLALATESCPEGKWS